MAEERGCTEANPVRNIKNSVLESKISNGAKRYRKIKNWLILVEAVLVISVLVAMISSGTSVYIRDRILALTQNPYLSLALYLGCVSLLFYLVLFPLGFYEGFLLEHRFSLSNQSLFGWLKEDVKKGLLSLVIGLPLIEVIYLFLRNFPKSWWIMAGFFWVGFTIVLSKFAPILIIPLFYKYRPLTDESLRQRLLSLARKSGTPAIDVFELNLSRNTKKANAGLLGMGSTRRIILSDTLLSNYSPQEIEAILAHELGHHRLFHHWKLLGFGALSAFLSLYLANILLTWAIQLFGFEVVYDIAAFPLLCLILFVFGLIIMPLQNGFARHLESDADLFALEKTGAESDFISAMEKLARQNLSDAEPTRFVEVLLYDHPPISKRIRMAREFAKRPR